MPSDCRFHRRCKEAACFATFVPTLRRVLKRIVSARFMERHSCREFTSIGVSCAPRRTPKSLIDAPRPELYDLAKDPGEVHNLFTDKKAVAEEMRAKLAGMIPLTVLARNCRKNRP